MTPLTHTELDPEVLLGIADNRVIGVGIGHATSVRDVARAVPLTEEFVASVLFPATLLVFGVCARAVELVDPEHEKSAKYGRDSSSQKGSRIVSEFVVEVAWKYEIKFL